MCCKPDWDCLRDRHASSHRLPHLRFRYDVGVHRPRLDHADALSRGEFGARAASRILALLQSRGIRSTWFTPGFTIETYPRECEAVVKASHEIAHHSWAQVPHGFVYDSSLTGADYLPYRVRQGDVAELGKPYKFGVELSLLEMPISWSLDDYPHFEFVRTPQAVLPGLACNRHAL
jgi:hypothetical protein